MKRPLNLIGPQVRKLRDRKGWTQEILAEKLQLAGWDISRTSLAKLEAQLRWVSDVELLFLSRVLRVDIADLYPGGVQLHQIGPRFRP
jgi:transcriptional regulator with XRE-family HTH domain